MLLQPGWGDMQSQEQEQTRSSRNRHRAAGRRSVQYSPEESGEVDRGRHTPILATAAGQPRLWQVLAARRQTRNLGQTRQRICRSTFLAHLCRLYFTARPMEDGLAEAIDDGKVGPRDDPKTRGKVLVDDFGWDKVPFSLFWLLVSYKNF